MREAALDRIELELVDDEIAITLRRQIGNLAVVRRISAQEALTLSRLFNRKPGDQVMNFEIGAWGTLQVENRPYDRIWLGITSQHRDSVLVACLEGDLIREVSQCLRHLNAAARDGALPMQSVPHIFPVAVCYLDE